MPVFDARSDYDPRRDVRDHGELHALVARLPQKGVLYPLIGARRAGKTWMLRALEHRLNGARPDAARYVDLRRVGVSLPEPAAGECLLLDEPELADDGEGARDPQALLAWCARAHAARAILLLAMTPAEWSVLEAAGEARGLVSARDLRFLAPLSDAQAKKLARTRAAKALLAKLPPLWRRSPFLLELVFQVAEEAAEADPSLAEEIWELLRAVRERSEDAEFFYFEAVYRNGLTAAQREVIEAMARGVEREPPEADLLRRAGLLARSGHRTVLADPILEANLLPLRIHHVSDVHFGPKSAERVDAKDLGSHASRMRDALGAPRVADAYAAHLAELAAAGRAPHLLVVSGDLAERALSAEFEAARAWIDAIRPRLADHPRLRPGEPNVLLVPGNHDVDWREAAAPGEESLRARHFAFARAFEPSELPRSLRPALEHPPASRPLALASYPELGLEIALLSSSELGGEPAGDRVRDELLGLIGRLRREALAERDADRVIALGAQISRIDPGLVHHADIERLARAELRQPVRVAVLHHPVSPLPMTELAPYAGLVNAGELKDTLVRRQFCLVLHGHTHTGWFGKEQWPERHEDRSLRIAAAPSLGSREVQEHNGYNEIEIRREPLVAGGGASGGASGAGCAPGYRITVRRLVREGTTWVERASMGPFAPGS